MSVTTVLVEKLRRVGIGVGARRQLTDGTTTPGPSTAIELVEENARLRVEVTQLRAEVARLTAEAAARGGPASTRQEEDGHDLDDASRRFSLLELDL